MRYRNCKVKVTSPNTRMAMGTLEEISNRNDGKAIVLETLHFLPVLDTDWVMVKNTDLQVTAALMEMCMRLSFKVRDFMGNMVHDFYGVNTFQLKALQLVTGEYCEDLTYKIWYGLDKMLETVFISIPFYAIKEVHYSVRTREIIFVGDYSSAVNPYVQFVNHDVGQHADSILQSTVYATGKEW